MRLGQEGPPASEARGTAPAVRPCSVAPGSPGESIPRGPRVLPHGRSCRHARVGVCAAHHRQARPVCRRTLPGGRADRALLGWDALGQDEPTRFPWQCTNERLCTAPRFSVSIGAAACVNLLRHTKYGQGLCTRASQEDRPRRNLWHGCVNQSIAMPLSRTRERTTTRHQSGTGVPRCYR
jgi:hypothetical protein